jgi:hypothetical protein
MSFTKDDLKIQIKKIYGPSIKTAEDGFRQWNTGLNDYIRFTSLAGYICFGSDVDIAPLFTTSVASETFIADFGKNVFTWALGTLWQQGSGFFRCKPAAALDFAAFSELHKNDVDIEQYQDDLAVYLHNWFSKITF